MHAYAIATRIAISTQKSVVPDETIGRNLENSDSRSQRMAGGKTMAPTTADRRSVVLVGLHHIQTNAR